MSYKSQQKKLQTTKLHEHLPSLFNYDKGYGNFDKYIALKYVLNDGKNNLFPLIAADSCSYFKENDITWWGDNKEYPTGHLLSSQIQCLNFLFALRSDKYAVLQLAQLFDPEIDDILPTIGDKSSGYIAFEFIYENAKLLGEDDNGAKRGEYCTSIDAFIIANRKQEKVLLPIEWKYTESYLEEKNKALEPGKGKTRQARYNKLIRRSAQLKSFDDLTCSCYYFEPFYELMRQTLLVEQMVNSGIANDFLHIVVIPSENNDLLGNNDLVTNDDWQTTWRNCLSDQSKFKVIDNTQIRQVIGNLPRYTDLNSYLKSRY